MDDKEKIEGLKKAMMMIINETSSYRSGIVRAARFSSETSLDMCGRSIMKIYDIAASVLNDPD